MSKNRQIKIRLISFAVAAVLIILGAGITGYSLAARYRTAIEYSYQRSLSQLSDYFTTIKSTLTKGIYANTPPQQYSFASKLMVESESAKNALAQLNLGLGETEALQKYFTQVGDFSSYMISTLSKGDKLSDDNISALKTLSEYADEVAPKMEELSALYGDGTNTLGIKNQLAGNIEENSDETKKLDFENSFTNLSESFTDYPSLIYDGPFADAVQQKSPRLTKNAEGYSVDEAKKNAAVFLNISEDKLEYTEARKGTIPVYVFKGNNIYITVTVKGGYICEMYRYNQAEGNNKLTQKKIFDKATEFLKQHNIKNMIQSYFVTANDICTINYAYKTSGTICYSDLIKIGVSTKDGKIMSYNAYGYIMNHTSRDIDAPSITQSKAMESVSKELKIDNTKIALIPTGGEKEVLCYEFTCTGNNNDRVIVYINGKTGLEEQIFILLQSDGGTLVM